MNGPIVCQLWFMLNTVLYYLVNYMCTLYVQFQVLHYKRKEDTEQLYSDTRTLLEHYNPGKVTKYTNQSQNVYSISVVRQDSALSGTCLEIHAQCILGHMSCT